MNTGTEELPQTKLENNEVGEKDTFQLTQNEQKQLSTYQYLIYRTPEPDCSNRHYSRSWLTMIYR